MLVNNLDGIQVLDLYKGLGYPEDRSVLYGGGVSTVSYLIDGEVRASRTSKRIHRDDLYLILTRQISTDNVMTDLQYDNLNKDYYKITKLDNTDIYVKVTRYVNTGGGIINFTDPVNNITMTSKPIETLLDGATVNDMVISIHSERYETLILSNGFELDTRPNTIEHKEVMIYNYFLNEEPVTYEIGILDARKSNMLYMDIEDYNSNHVVIDNPYNQDDTSQEILQMEIYVTNRKAADANETRAMEIDIAAKKLELAVIEHERKISTLDILIEELVDKYHKVKHIYYVDIDASMLSTGDRLALLDSKLTALYTEEDVESVEYMDFIKKFSKDIYDALSQTI